MLMQKPASDASRRTQMRLTPLDPIRMCAHQAIGHMYGTRTHNRRFLFAAIIMRERIDRGTWTISSMGHLQPARY